MDTPDLSPSMQDYLKVIWTAREWSKERVSSRAIAQRLGHSPSTVSETIKRLDAQGLVTHERYGDVELTTTGRNIALAMVRRHRLIETFLVEYLGYAWDEVHDEAEVLEHAVSDDFIERLADRLGHPDRDPHGDPIPSAAGQVPDVAAIRLSEVATPASVRVARVSDADADLLRYLDDLAIGLDTAVRVLERHDAAGTLSAEIDGHRVQLGLRAADAIWVVAT
ncbi:metal-dependent transcriptional regulator [Aeromicrobium sp. CTD01-1L150]|uniref:metal-dependent transcriptional regulator n=1 Tax=Aeromicrobium sp. CTD01-1L150 TaxID=3341830 RepID=UPI0035BF69C6